MLSLTNSPFPSDFNPFTVVESQAKAEAFLEDQDPYALNLHDLTTQDVTTLWSTNKPLCEKVIGKVHQIFSDFRTNKFPVRDKLNRGGVIWKQFESAILLGANATAAQEGNILAKELCIYASIKRITLPLDPETGLKYLRECMNAASIYSIYLFGTLNSSSKVGAKVRYEARKALRYTAIRQHPLGLYQRAFWYRSQKPKMEINLLKIASETGLAEAQNELGLKYFSGEGVVACVKKSASLFARAAEQGYEPALNNIGYYYYHSLYFDSNPLLAYECFLTAAHRGHGPAMLNLAYCLTHGLGCESNFIEAMEWSEKAKTAKNNTVGLLLKDSDGEFSLKIFKNVSLTSEQ